MKPVGTNCSCDSGPAEDLPSAQAAQSPGLRKRLLPWLLWSQLVPAPLAMLVPEAVAPAGAAVLGFAVARLAPPPEQAMGLLGLRRPSAGWLPTTLILLLPILTWSRLVALPLAVAVPVGEAVEPPLGSFLTLVVFAPLFEELLFRGLLLELWRPKGRLVALCFTSLLFALGHGLWLLPSTLLIGWFLGWLAWEYNSIWPAFAVHAANNLFSTVLGRYLLGSPEGAAFGSLAVATVLFAGLVLSFRARAQLRSALVAPWHDLPPGTRRRTLATELGAAVRLWPVAVVVVLCLINMLSGAIATRW
ncbi:MAG: CPBP family intramembrane metalloprotease [Bacillota bacterium]|nr:CPBP family intramembrane metalloprotease [Bacillota bacterium]